MCVLRTDKLKYIAMHIKVLQRNLSKTATCESDQTDLYREVAALQRLIAMLYRYWGPGRLAVSEWWLPNTVTTLDRFHYIRKSIKQFVHTHTVNLPVQWTYVPAYSLTQTSTTGSS